MYLPQWQRYDHPVFQYAEASATYCDVYASYSTWTGSFIRLYVFSFSKESSNISISAYKDSLGRFKAAAASLYHTKKWKEIKYCK